MEHLTSVPNGWGWVLFYVSAFNHERVSMSCLQQLIAFRSAVMTAMYNKPAQPSKSSPNGTQHSEQHHATVNVVYVASECSCISYVSLCKATL